MEKQKKVHAKYLPVTCWTMQPNLFRKKTRRAKSHYRKAKTLLRQKGEQETALDSKESCLRIVKKLKLDGVTEDDDATLTKEECVTRLSKAKDEEQRAKKMIKVGKKNYADAKRKAATNGAAAPTVLDVTDSKIMMEQGLVAVGISSTMLARARATKGGVVKRHMQRVAAKMLRYVSIMRKRGVKRTKGQDSAEKAKIANYADKYVKKSYRDQATDAEKVVVDAAVVAVQVAAGDDECCKLTAEDKVVEEIALWDEMEKKKDIETASVQVAGGAVVEVGGTLEMEARTVVKVGSFSAETDSTVSIKSGGKLTVARDDDEADNEIKDGSDDDEEKVDSASSTEPTKYFAIEKGAEFVAESESELIIERPVFIDGNAEINGGKMIIQKDDQGTLVGKEAEEDEGNTFVVKAVAEGVLTVSGGSVVSGVGTVSAGKIESRGSTIAPGNSPGTFTVDGDLSLDSESVLQFEIMDAAEDQHDVLQITGKMTLGGTINVEAGNTCLQPVTVITTETGLTGNVNTFNAGSTEGAVGSKSEDGYDYKIGCQKCAANQKVVKGSDANAMGTCTACPAGKTNTLGDVPWGAATTCIQPITKCQVGEHVENGACTVCPSGSSRDVEDMTSNGDTQCDVTYCEDDQHVQNHQCQICPEGTTRASGDDATGIDTTCVAVICPANTHVTSNECVACGEGLAQPAGDDASGADTSCNSCTVNYHVVDSDSTPSCRACNTANGEFNDRCVGTGCDLLSGGDTVCASADEYCAINQKRTNDVCGSCEAGTEQKTKVLKTGTDTTCSAITCAQNYHVSSHTCTQCDAGKFVAAGGDASSAQDTTCTAEICIEDFHVVNKKCQSCENGMFRDQGDLTTDEDSTCAPKICEENEYVVADKCAACPDGTTRKAGADTSKDNGLTCTSTCTENHYVAGFVCTMCPAGTTRPAGDIAGDDAKKDNGKTCTATVCQKDEFVENNVCVPCAVGTTRVAGADASQDNNQDACRTVFKGSSVSGALEFSSISVADAQAAETFFSQVISTKYGVELARVTVDSIEASAAGKGRRRRLLASTSVVVKYTVTGFANQNTASAAKTKFDVTVTDGSFLTALQSVDSSFSNVRVKNVVAPPTVTDETVEPINTPAASGNSGAKSSSPLGLIAGICGGILVLFSVSIVAYFYQQGNKSSNETDNNTKVTPTPVTPGFASAPVGFTPVATLTL